MLIYISDFDSKQREDITNISMENNVSENKNIHLGSVSIAYWGETLGHLKNPHIENNSHGINERFSFN